MNVELINRLAPPKSASTQHFQVPAAAFTDVLALKSPALIIYSSVLLALNTPQAEVVTLAANTLTDAELVKKILPAGPDVLNVTAVALDRLNPVSM